MLKIYYDMELGKALVSPKAKPETMKGFKYKPGDWVWQYTKHDDYERAKVLECKVINGHNCYITDLVDQWEHESFLLG